MRKALVPLLVVGLTACSSDQIAPNISTYKSVEYYNPTPRLAMMLCIGQSNMTDAMLNHLITMLDNYDEVRFINVAEGGSSIDRWMPSGDLFERIENVSDVNFTHILVHQGESDRDNNNYINQFLAMLQGIRDLGINSPLYLAQTSWLNNKTDASIIQQQGELIATYDDILQGAMTDQLGVEYRIDGSHFNEAGLIAHAELWAGRIK